MRLSPFPILVVVAFTLGCGAAPVVDPPVEAAVGVTVLASAPKSAAPLPLERPEVTLKRELCERSIERQPTPESADDSAPPRCALVSHRDIGSGGYVALLYRGEVQYRADELEAIGLSTEGDTDTFGIQLERCHPFEYWLASVADGHVTKPQLITAICNDGHGAAGVGEDSVTVAAQSITVSSSGGSNWRWGYTEAFSLPDLGLLRESSSGYWSVSTNTDDTQWSWNERRGSDSWSAPRCSVKASEPPPETFSHALVPSYEVAPALAGEGWKNASSLEGCATIVDGQTGGFTLSGSADPASAKLGVLAADDQLFVEVRDDKLVTEGRVRDELEVWHRVEPAGDWSACIDDPEPASGTAIRMGSLATRALGDASIKPLTVEAAPRSDAVVRLRISLPPKTSAVTIVYRDTDDGKRHARVFGTSTFDAKDDVTLGRLHPIPKERASCELSGRAPALVMKHELEPNRAITR
ncbi:MAG: hypothetical protein JNK04_19805 [Myxococcales bacterium]|nr:hypothetical protein [Myxococcales bacterium]